MKLDTKEAAKDQPAAIEKTQSAPGGSVPGKSGSWSKFRKKLISLSTLRRISSVLIFLGLWGAVVQTIPNFHQIPGPWKVFLALFNISPNLYLMEIVRSFLRVLAGFILGAAVGFPIGVAIGYSRIFNYMLFPAVEIFRPIPPISWIPLSVLFFVNIESQIVFLTFYGAFFPIVYNTISGISNVDIQLPRAAMSFGVSKTQLLFRVILPAASPQIFAGLKIAVGITWLMVVAAEMIASKGGLGYLTWYNHTVMNYPMVFIGMGTIGVVGALSSLGIDRIGLRFTKWMDIF
jgi:NitT/TauT family transport system permease protein